MKKIRNILSLVLMLGVVFSAIPVPASAEEPTRRDVVFVLDCSGSIRQADTDRAAAELYRLLMADCPRETTRVGVVCFTNYLEYCSDALRSLESDADYQAAVAEADHMTYTGRDTDIALGLRAAQELLAGSTAEEKLIVLVGDGATDLPNGPRTEQESAEELNTLLRSFQEHETRVISVKIAGTGEQDSSTMEHLGKQTGGAVYEMTKAEDAAAIASEILDYVPSSEAVTVESGCFAELYGSILEKYFEMTTDGTLQAVDTTVSITAANAPAVPVSTVVTSDPVSETTGEEDKGTVLQRLFDELEKLQDKIGGKKDAADAALAGDQGALNELTGGADESASAEETASAAQNTVSVPVLPAENTASFENCYLILKSDGWISDLRLSDKTNTELTSTDFYDLEDGYYGIALSPFNAQGGVGDLQLQLRGEAGKTVELLTLNLNRVSVNLELDDVYMRPNEAHRLILLPCIDGIASPALASHAVVNLTLTEEGSGTSVPVTMNPAEDCLTAGVQWSEEGHLRMQAEASFPAGGLPCSRTVSIRCGVTELPIQAKSTEGRFLLLLCGMKGTGGPGKTLQYGDLVEYDPQKVITAEISPSNAVALENDGAAQKIRLTSLRAYTLSSFTLTLSDGFATVELPFRTFSAPLLVVVFSGLLIVGLIGLIFLGIYRKKHTQFIGKLYLKFDLAPEQKELSVEDSELIFPYVRSITLWELIAINESMYTRLLPILAETGFERVTKNVRIDSRQKDQIWVYVKNPLGDISVNGTVAKKKELTVLQPDDSMKLRFMEKGLETEVTLYRNPNSVESRKITYEAKKTPVRLDEKSEDARRRMSEYSRQVPEAVKAESPEELAVSRQESVNYYVFASLLGMLKQDKEDKAIRLYRDTIDFSPVTLIDTGLIDNDLYYHVYKSFCSKLDRSRRELLDAQMRELLTNCMSDSEKAGRLEKQTRIMMLNYSTMKRSALESGEAAENTQQVVEFYDSVAEVCKQVLGKIDF